MDIKSANKPKKLVATHVTKRPALGAGSEANNRSKRRKKRSISHKKTVRYGLLVANLAVFLVVGSMIIFFSDSNAADYTMSKDGIAQTNPLDELSAADIAVNVARVTNLPETNSVINFADTVNSELETYTLNTETARLPQILSADIKTLADIKEYISVPGDTVASLATKFGVTSDSIKWSNDLTSDDLDPGTKLLIPPTNGMIYTIRSGDTPEKVAQLYQISLSQLIVFNDLEDSSMIPGHRIFLPNAQKPTSASNFAVRYGYNGYDPGWCTYYASARGGAPGGWGHARTWAVNAVRTPGWFVSKVPVPGAIAQTTGIAGDRVGGSWGHVGVVEQVKEENGQIFIKYSDMNGLAGFNRVGHSDWVPALSKFQNFIYRIE